MSSLCVRKLVHKGLCDDGKRPDGSTIRTMIRYGAEAPVDECRGIGWVSDDDRYSKWGADLNDGVSLGSTLGSPGLSLLGHWSSVHGPKLNQGENSKTILGFSVS
jgi:hypothetical protein